MNPVKFYEIEKPVVISTLRNEISYFEIAQKLQVSMPCYTDKTTGEKKHGKTVTLDLNVLRSTPGALDSLKSIFNKL